MAQNTPDQQFLALTCLTGSDSQKVLAQTQQLQPPVPAEGSPEYQTFITDFSKSPANVMSSLAQYLQNRAAWTPQSGKGFQSYVASYNGAPFILGYGGGTSQIFSNVHNTDDLITALLDTAGVPHENRDAVIAQLNLENWFDGDFEDNPKSVQIITQNMVAANGQIQLVWNDASMTISYYPPEKKGIVIKKSTDPTYKITGSATNATANAQLAGWFAANAEQFIKLGFTNVTDWLKNSTTPETTV